MSDYKKSVFFNRYQLIVLNWWDKTNGNNYIAAKLYDTKTDKLLKVWKFQYGDARQCEYEALQHLKEASKRFKKFDEFGRNGWSALIISSRENCKKRDLKEFAV